MNVIGLEYALDLYTVNAGIAERAYQFIKGIVTLSCSTVVSHGLKLSIIRKCEANIGYYI